MRFLIAHKTDTRWEQGAVPGPELVARVGAMIGRLSAAGVFESGEGLGPTSKGVRLRVRGGTREVRSGPFEGEHELPASLTILRTRTLDEAVEWAAAQAAVLGDADLDIRPVNEPWDIGLVPRPDGLDTTRHMVVRKADAATESGAGPAPSQRAALAGLIRDATAAGIHLVTETVRPSARGRRYLNTSNGVRVFDGPFVESTELLGGYVVVSGNSLDDVDPWARDYLAAVGPRELDVLELG